MPAQLRNSYLHTEAKLLESCQEVCVCGGGGGVAGMVCQQTHRRPSVIGTGASMLQHISAHLKKVMKKITRFVKYKAMMITALRSADIANVAAFNGRHYALQMTSRRANVATSHRLGRNRVQEPLLDEVHDGLRDLLPGVGFILVPRHFPVHLRRKGR